MPPAPLRPAFPNPPMVTTADKHEHQRLCPWDDAQLHHHIVHRPPRYTTRTHCHPHRPPPPPVMSPMSHSHQMQLTTMRPGHHHTPHHHTLISPTHPLLQPTRLPIGTGCKGSGCGSRCQGGFWACQPTDGLYGPYRCIDTFFVNRIPYFTGCRP